MWLKATLLNGPMFNCWQETISSYLHEKCSNAGETIVEILKNNAEMFGLNVG